MRIGKVARVAGVAVVNLIEISLSSLSLMIKIAGLENEPWAKDLQEVLFWLEVASLSREFSVAIANKLRVRAGSNPLKKEKEKILKNNFLKILLT